MLQYTSLSQPLKPPIVKRIIFGCTNESPNHGFLPTLLFWYSHRLKINSY